VHRVNRTADRRVALMAAPCVCVCISACESTAPASPSAARIPPAEATEWLGTHTAAPVPQAAADVAASGSWVLHIGDSFTEAGLKQNLWHHFRAAGSAYVVDARTATYTTTWAGDQALADWLAKGPSLVLVTLGANEVDMPVPGAHARAVEAISRTISRTGAACVWISPPTWKKDTGILQVIHDHCAPCLFADSDAITGGLAANERQPDGIHPNRRGGARWAEAVWGWLSAHRDPSRGPWALVPFEWRGP
jgi:lysophospholipase L1-like esterase